MLEGKGLNGFCCKRQRLKLKLCSCVYLQLLGTLDRRTLELEGQQKYTKNKTCVLCFVGVYMRHTCSHAPHWCHTLQYKCQPSHLQPLSSTKTGGHQVHAMDFLGDVAAGALQPGTNLATVITLNVLLLLVLLSLIPLLAFAWASQPALVPRVLVLMFLALGLWGLMIWMVGVTGIVPTQQQQSPAATAATEAAAAAAAAAEDSKEGSKKQS